MNAKIVYVPLDERPCNYRFPQMQFPTSAGVELIRPPIEILGSKKRPAAVDRVLEWLEAELSHSDGAVLSLEMLIYGGLLPSRIHRTEHKLLAARVERVLGAIQRERSRRGFPVFVFGLIMRTPSYSNSEEEPDYYDRFGAQIFRTGFLDHKRRTTALSDQETAELHRLRDSVPAEILADYTQRRTANRGVLQAIVAALASDAVDVLVLPQDDTAEFGFGPSDREQIMTEVSDRGVAGSVLTYPGADEVGCTLTARMALRLADAAPPQVKLVFREAEAAARIPPYESVPLNQSVPLQVQVCGAECYREGTATSPPDIVIFINTSQAETDYEARDQYARDQHTFVGRIEQQLGDRIHAPAVGLCDVAYANGGETGLVEQLHRRRVWNRLASYAGWNTAGNTIGTCIARALLEHLWPDDRTRLANLAYRLADDWAYQAIVRGRRQEPPQPAVAVKELNRELRRLADSGAPEVYAARFPWNRRFEIELEVKTAPR